MLDSNASLKDIIDVFEQIDSKIIDRGGAQTIIPSTTNKVLVKGNYRGDITVKGDANLISANILNGKNIFGVSGGVIPKNIASGTINSEITKSGPYNNPNHVLAGTINLNLSFTPSLVLLHIPKVTWSNADTILNVNLDSRYNDSSKPIRKEPLENYNCLFYFKNISSQKIEIWMHGQFSGGTLTLHPPLLWTAYE